MKQRIGCWSQWINGAKSNSQNFILQCRSRVETTYNCGYGVFRKCSSYCTWMDEWRDDRKPRYREKHANEREYLSGKFVGNCRRTVKMGATVRERTFHKSGSASLVAGAEGAEATRDLDRAMAASTTWANSRHLCRRTGKSPTRTDTSTLSAREKRRTAGAVAPSERDRRSARLSPYLPPSPLPPTIQSSLALSRSLSLSVSLCLSLSLSVSLCLRLPLPPGRGPRERRPPGGKEKSTVRAASANSNARRCVRVAARTRFRRAADAATVVNLERWPMPMPRPPPSPWPSLWPSSSAPPPPPSRARRPARRRGGPRVRRTKRWRRMRRTTKRRRRRRGTNARILVCPSQQVRRNGPPSRADRTTARSARRSTSASASEGPGSGPSRSNARPANRASKRASKRKRAKAELPILGLRCGSSWPPGPRFPPRSPFLDSLRRGPTRNTLPIAARNPFRL
jgi:hypothetical protein